MVVEKEKRIQIGQGAGGEGALGQDPPMGSSCAGTSRSRVGEAMVRRWSLFANGVKLVPLVSTGRGR